MFTGIIEGVGRIAAATAQGDGLRIAVDVGVCDVADIALGDSVAVSGCCLTVTAIAGATLTFDVSAETLACTTGLDRLGDANIELAVRMGDRLGGHLVSGHVDGVGTVHAFHAVVDDRYGSWRLAVDAPTDLARFIARKGSIAIDGVSLTVNAVEASRFDVNLIPHTLAVTTLKRLQPGSRVNLEIDMVARYVERMSQVDRETGNESRREGRLQDAAAVGAPRDMLGLNETATA
jgi:riboflavin synthase